MTLYQFRRLHESEQRKYIAKIEESGQSLDSTEWNNVSENPGKVGYYPVIMQYVNFTHTRRIGVARWTGSYWADCYENERTTGLKNSGWNILQWASNVEG